MLSGVDARTMAIHPPGSVPLHPVQDGMLGTSFPDSFAARILTISRFDPLEALTELQRAEVRWRSFSSLAVQTSFWKHDYVCLWFLQGSALA